MPSANAVGVVCVSCWMLCTILLFAMSDYMNIESVVTVTDSSIGDAPLPLAVSTESRISWDSSPVDDLLFVTATTPSLTNCHAMDTTQVIPCDTFIQEVQGNWSHLLATTKDTGPYNPPHWGRQMR
jgi:hypothetical protein